MRIWGLFLAGLLGGFALAALAILPPAPRGMDAPLTQFSSARAMQDVRVISATPHITGSDENTQVRAYLMARMSALDMVVQETEGKLGARALKRFNQWSGSNKSEQSFFNVVGVLPGADRTKPAVLLMAHHDTVPGSPGAADDSLGVSSILEIVRAVTETGRPARDLIVVFTDGEELGLSGATRFFANNPLQARVGAIINFEARGGGGTSDLFQTSAGNGAAARLYAKSVKQPGASSLSTFIYSILPNDTDLTPALETGVLAYNIANIGAAQYYHSPKATPEALDPRTLQHMGSQGLDLTQALLTANELPQTSPDATFFDVFGLFTVVYAPFWGWVFLALTALFYAASTTRDEAVKHSLWGAVQMLLALILGGVGLYVLNVLSGSGASSNYYDRLAAIPKLEVMAVFVLMSVLFAVFGGKASSANTRFGAAIPFFVIGVVLQVLAPTASYFITVPLLLCGAASWGMSKFGESLWARAVSLFLITLIIGFMTRLGHLLMLGVGPDLPSVAALIAMIAVLALLPVYPGLSKRLSLRVAGVALVLAIGMAVWIRLDPVAVTVPLY